jgi:DNA-directed RNA polymerase subunit RPC12/RpoP/DNA-binding XRE family transcriptional regulator
MNEVFRCDNCGRLLSIENLEDFSCSSCGHGRMKPLKPKNYCYKCHRPIYDNVDPSRDVLCSLCTQILISRPINLPDQKDLKDYRKSKGYSILTMAHLTGVSFQYYSDMENGRKPLNKKTLDILMEGLL